MMRHALDATHYPGLPARPRWIPLLVAVAVILPSCTPTGAAEPTEEPKKIRKSILHDGLLWSTQMPEGAGVIVRQFATEGADLRRAKETDDQNVIEATRHFQTMASDILAREIARRLTRAKEIPWVRVSEETGDENAVILEGEFTVIDAGYRGLGGGSTVRVRGKIRSAAGELLVEFSHTQGASVTMTTVPREDHITSLTKATRDVGSDIAKFLRRWAKGRYD